LHDANRHSATLAVYQPKPDAPLQARLCVAEGRKMAATVDLWTGVAGAAALLVGGFVARKDFAAARGLDKLTTLACVFFAAPLAAFGAEHLTDAHTIAQIIPQWMPGRLFWAYFVGVALIAAGLSLSLKRYLRLTGTLTALMFFLFVAMMHIPGAIATPRDRFAWAILIRDLSFGCGALALAGAMSPRKSAGGNAAITVARILLAVGMIVFGVEHLLHPGNAPGVPLEKMTPAWVPLPYLWAWITGVVLIVAGVAILINRHAHQAALWAGLVQVLITLFLYTPILVMARGAMPVLVGLNYVFDTLLYGGAILLLALATGKDRPLAGQS
jgi:uncharacterized membrane protein